MEKRKSFMPTGQLVGDYISLSKKKYPWILDLLWRIPIQSHRVEYNQFNDDWAIQAIKKDY